MKASIYCALERKVSHLNGKRAREVRFGLKEGVSTRKRKQSFSESFRISFTAGWRRDGACRQLWR